MSQRGAILAQTAPKAAAFIKSAGDPDFAIGPSKVVNLRIRVRRLVYDAPGTYLFALTDDDDKDPVLAQRRVYVYEAGKSP